MIVVYRDELFFCDLASNKKKCLLNNKADISSLLMLEEDYVLENVYSYISAYTKTQAGCDVPMVTC